MTVSIINCLVNLSTQVSISLFIQSQLSLLSSCMVSQRSGVLRRWKGLLILSRLNGILICDVSIVFIHLSSRLDVAALLPELIVWFISTVKVLLIFDLLYILDGLIIVYELCQRCCVFMGGLLGSVQVSLIDFLAIQVL
jgi:hypothetical protein